MDSFKQKLPSLNPKRSAYIVIGGFLLTSLFNCTEAVPVLFIPAISFAFLILIGMAFIPLEYIIYPLFILILNMPDMTQSAEEIEILGVVLSASPWQVGAGPITPAFFIFAALLIPFYRLFKHIRLRGPFLNLFIYFGIIAVIASIWFGYLQESLSRFIIDAKIPMFFCVGLMIFSAYYKRFPRNFLISSQIFFCIAIGTFCFDLVKFILNQSSAIESTGYQNLSLDSAKGLVVIFLFYAISKLMEGKKMPFYLIVMAISFYLLLAYQTRWLIVTTVLGLVIAGIFLGLKRVFILSVFTGIFLMIAIPIMIKIAPETWRIAMLRLSFVEDLGASSTLEDVEIGRAGSIYNSTNMLWERKTFLTGMGYGSWYNDSYFPMPFLNISAFDEDSLNKGRYYRVHDFTFHFLFKFGIIGLALYAYSFIRPIRKIWRLKTVINKNTFFRQAFLILIGLTPMVLTYMWFSGKALLFGAFFIVITYHWASYCRNFIQYKAGTSFKPQ